MKNAKILDCTLRDGAYLVDKYFGEDIIRGIVQGLIDSKVDYIELGFLQNEGFGEGKTIFKNCSDANVYIPKNNNNSKFTLFADYSRYDIKNLDYKKNNKVEIIRECFFKNERYDAIKTCKVIKEKGYKLFIQPVDILGYNDQELIELIELANHVSPDCFSIVDTFGSMYQEDLKRVYSIIDNNLIKSSKIGFHSHNNLQLSSSLSQYFFKMGMNSGREIVIDGTISGMGKGAGNTPTELLMQYLVKKQKYNYDINYLLDTIDVYIENFKSKCTWGYTTPYFIAGSFGAHVNNVLYLKEKNNIKSKDIRSILNLMNKEIKRYNYSKLEKKYLKYIESDIDDNKYIDLLSENLINRDILVLSPGFSLNKEYDKILDYIYKIKPIIITVNFISNDFNQDYVYISNMRRYNYLKYNKSFKNSKKILSSRINDSSLYQNHDFIINVSKLINLNLNNSENSTIMLLRLLDFFQLKSIALAGFDGYSITSNKRNYYNENIEISKVKNNPAILNSKINEIFLDYLESRSKKKTPVYFVTKSIFNNKITEKSHE